MIHHGDCLEVMAAMEPESVDAIVTDPPYGLEFMGKGWDRLSDDPNIGKARAAGFDAASGKRDQRAGNEGGTWFGSRDASTPNYYRATNAKCRACGKWRVSGGHDGKGNTLGCQCERPDFPNVRAEASRRMGEWHERWATEALRIAKPGAHLLAFGGTRTYHRLAAAIEDAGWEIRDCLVWAYASGFPKSLNPGRVNDANACRANDTHTDDPAHLCPAISPSDFYGLGTALKPAWEPIVMARKALRGTVIGNVIEYGTGALNIDGTRIGPPLTPEEIARTGGVMGIEDGRGIYGQGKRRPAGATRQGEPSANRRYADEPGDFAALPGPRGGDPLGRWPANVLLTDPIFDGDTPGVVGGGTAGGNAPASGPTWEGESGSASRQRMSGMGDREPQFYGDGGTYSRFYLIPKAARSDRDPILGGIAPRQDKAHRRTGVVDNPRLRGETFRANFHPTVKPTDLMRHLVRLVTPPGGTVLDPFLGSGTTAIACELEGFPWIGIEKEAEYVAIAEARLNGTQRGLGLSA